MNVAKRQRAIPIALGILVGLATVGGGGWLSVQLVRAEWWFLDIPEKSEFNANFQMAWVGLALFLLVVGFGELAIAMRAMKPAPAPRRPASPS
ncbi:hypothetical protein KYC5002_32715 [Archangium violaceum]|uniref:hypothetical protein n=1 Tax=Archangium violaceum TaxID=83451 RepID=UPI002B307F5E|nr:hypothetical protein KYC5002_32715 [Archangium gephyra]